MDINLFLDAKLYTGSATASNFLNLQLNQIVEATVLDQQTPFNTISLQIAGTVVQAQPPIDANLSAGQKLQLQLVKLIPVPEFKLLAPTANTQQTTSASINKPLLEQLNDYYKQLLPIQNSPVDLLKQLLALQQKLSFSAALQQLTNTILSTLPQPKQLQHPETLKSLIDQSGLFLEAKLLKQLLGTDAGNLSQDLKFNWLKLAKALSLAVNQAELSQLEQNSLKLALTKQSEDENRQTLLQSLLTKTNASLALLTIEQLQSLPDDSLKQRWLIELPFLDQGGANVLKMLIEQDKPDKKADNHQIIPVNWQVTITLTPPELATIHCKISCYDNTVNTAFWSDAPLTVAKISNNLDSLKQQFELKGINTGFMEARQGKSEHKTTLIAPLANLLNEQA